MRGFAAGPSSHWAITHIWIIDGTGYKDGAKAIWPWTKRLRSVVFASKQTALDSSAQLFERLPACQTEHFATTSQLLKRWRQFDLYGTGKICFINSTDQITEECVCLTCVWPYNVCALCSECTSVSVCQ